MAIAVPQLNPSRLARSRRFVPSPVSLISWLAASLIVSRMVSLIFFSFLVLFWFYSGSISAALLSKVCIGGLLRQ
jgi:hypothetical protein